MHVPREMQSRALSADLGASRGIRRNLRYSRATMRAAGVRTTLLVARVPERTREDPRGPERTREDPRGPERTRRSWSRSFAWLLWGGAAPHLSADEQVLPFPVDCF